MVAVASEMTSPGPSKSLSTISAEVSPGPSLAQLPGRPKRSPVWEYFHYDSAEDRSICQVENPDTESLCGKSIAGKNPTNLKQHLKAVHPAVSKDVSGKEEDAKKLKLEKDRKKCQASLKHYQQSTIKESFSRQTMYGKDNKQYKAITRKLAIFVGSSNVANSLVENFFFFTE